MSLKAQQFLSLAAHFSQRERELISRQEISHKLNEIKYLAAQRKVPKLSLRKEIVHLEHQLGSLYEFEKRLAKDKRHESATVRALRKQIAVLRRRLAVSEDKDMQKRVEKLTFLLGECLAAHQTKRDVSWQRRVVQEKTKPSKEEKIRMLQDRLGALKEHLAQAEDKNPQTAAKLQQMITQVEDKLQSYSQKYSEHPTTLVVPEEKHIVLFSPSAKEDEDDLELEKELPLPPPPKMKKEEL